MFDFYIFSCRVSSDLEVRVVKIIDCSQMIIKTPDSVKMSKSEVEIESPVGRTVPIRKKRIIDDTEELGPNSKKIKGSLSVSGGVGRSSIRSQADWIQYLDEHFDEVILGGNCFRFVNGFNMSGFLGLDVVLRERTKHNITHNIKLTPRQNAGVINSVNFSIKEQFGLQRPNPNLCRSSIYLF